MTTSVQWWDSVKHDPTRFADWLMKQYRGEVTAGTRIEEFATQYAPERDRKVLNIIAAQERQHAEWVLGLLTARGIKPVVDNAEDRYWRQTLPEIESFETGAAVGAHAEAMRLERIKTICDDESSPTDVRDVFQRILKDELFHERAFRKMAGPVAMSQVMDAHARGREVLGLEA